MKPNSSVEVIFKDDLNDFLPNRQRGKSVETTYSSRRSVKDLIESLGVPHAEVDRIMVDGTPVLNSYSVKAGDRIEVFPLQRLADAYSLIPREGLRNPSFIVDDNVARLAKILRLLGFDAEQQKHLPDAGIVERAKQTGRIILTRDRGLLKRRDVALGFYVRQTAPYLQAEEIIEKLQLRPLIQGISRCLVCNGELFECDDNDLKDRSDIPESIKTLHHTFYGCSICSKTYWEGSHYERMQRNVEQFKEKEMVRTVST